MGDWQDGLSSLELGCWMVLLKDPDIDTSYYTYCLHNGANKYFHPLHGCKYDLRHRSKSPLKLQQLKPQVHFVCFQWQDVPGLLRGNIVPIGYALQLATVKKHIWLSPVGLHRAVDNSFIPWLDLRGMHCLVAD